MNRDILIFSFSILIPLIVFSCLVALIKISSISNNMDGLWEYYVKWNRPDTERQLLYDCPQMRKTSQIHRDQKKNGGARGWVGGTGREWGLVGTVWEDETVPWVDGGDAPQQDAWTSCPWTVHLKTAKTINCMCILSQFLKSSMHPWDGCESGL